MLWHQNSVCQVTQDDVIDSKHQLKSALNSPNKMLSNTAKWCEYLKEPLR